MNNKIKINLKKLNETAKLPIYATQDSAGMDLYANIKEALKIQPLERVIIPTGISIELPTGFEAQIRPRSGAAIKNGITVINSPGTIDPDYRGEIKVGLINLSNEPVIIMPCDRIAQMVIAKYEKVEWKEVTELSNTNRGTGGFGSTGTK